MIFQKIKIILAVFIVEEIIAFVTFWYIRKKFAKQTVSEHSTALISVFKGILERLVIYIGLLTEIYPILIFFSAIKLGTRIDSKDKISND